MSAEDDRDATEAAASPRYARGNRRMLLVIGLVTTAVVAWNLYVQLLAR